MRMPICALAVVLSAACSYTEMPLGETTQVGTPLEQQWLSLGASSVPLLSTDGTAQIDRIGHWASVMAMSGQLDEWQAAPVRASALGRIYPFVLTAVGGKRYESQLECQSGTALHFSDRELAKATAVGHLSFLSDQDALTSVQDYLVAKQGLISQALVGATSSKAAAPSESTGGKGEESQTATDEQTGEATPAAGSAGAGASAPHQGLSEEAEAASTEAPKSPARILTQAEQSSAAAAEQLTPAVSSLAELEDAMAALAQAHGYDDSKIYLPYCIRTDR